MPERILALHEEGSSLEPGNEQGFVQLPVTAVCEQTDDIRSFRLARPRAFDFKAGQYLAVVFGVNGERAIRRFSVSSAPETPGYIEITVKRRGPVSRALHRVLGVGSLLSVRPPEGTFLYPDGDDRPLLLIAGGVGCTPIMSMLRHAALRDPTRPVACLLSVRTEKDLAFRQELVLLKRLHPRLRLGVTLTRESRPGFRGGRIGEALLSQAVPDPANTDVRLCAPVPMMEEMGRLLEGLGVAASRIGREVFDNASVGSGEESTESSRPPTPVPPPSVVTASDTREAEIPPADRDVPFPRKDQVRQVLRFAKGEMMLHWAIAIPFMVCFATGVTLKLFYPLHASSLVRGALSVIHRIAGAALALLPALAIARNWRDYKLHIDNVKVGFSWTIDDLKWLFLVGPSTLSKRIVLPDQRKFNAAERLNFMMVMVTYPLFVTTGFFLWWHGVDHFIPWIIHISLSLVPPLLMLGHIYMAVVNPSTRVGLSGMFTGRVDREWAKHHYRRWYEENFEENGTPKKKRAAESSVRVEGRADPLH